ncbi:MAG: Trk system potassium transporter TrkA, partial [Candidatus Delongbacteria bacterium]|nr:Trk system potassium transporter TrkA [Candidatus Delongbacteria bacterium]
MNILIVGGGEVGYIIAERLISEGHNVTIIEKDENRVATLNNELDAFVLHGSGIYIKRLKQAKIEKVDLFLALTNDDNKNIISCSLAKKLGNNITTIAKVENYIYYFSDDRILPADYGVDQVVASTRLAINKLQDLIKEPDAIENMYFYNDKIQIIGVNIPRDFSLSGMTLKQIASEHPEWQRSKIIAIKHGDGVIIPTGNDTILPGDKLYIIGTNKILKDVLSKYFTSKKKIKDIVIFGGNRIGKEFAQSEAAKGKNVTIFDDDIKVCRKLSEELNNILVIHGSGTNQKALEEINMKDACVVCVTSDDEYNIISAVLAKENGAIKAICNIRNISVGKIVNQISDIDSVFSPEELTLAEVLKYCRKGNILSVTHMPNLNAETINIHISENIPIIDKPLKDVKFPKGMIIGALVRDEKVIIPSGNDEIKLNDIVIAFVLPDAIAQAEDIFAKILSKR